MADNAFTLLKVACDHAYEKNPGSCSHSVWDVIKACANPTETYRQANQLIDHMTANWTEVTLDKGHELAQKGTVVVGGLKGAANGHVIVIYPGDKIDSGGYEYLYKKQNKNLTMPSHGKYPPAMSTSLGSWPGAMSDGDKTVWDPWANDITFKDVKFWTPTTTAK